MSQFSAISFFDRFVLSNAKKSATRSIIGRVFPFFIFHSNQTTYFIHVHVYYSFSESHFACELIVLQMNKEVEETEQI